MVWHLALDRHVESVLTTFADLLTCPASRRALARRDIAAVYRKRCTPDCWLRRCGRRTT
jgi:hypothetical protein